MKQTTRTMLCSFVKTCSKDALRLEAIKLIMILDGDLSRSAFGQDAASIQPTPITAASSEQATTLEQLAAEPEANC
jgi:hypothetical protein